MKKQVKKAVKKVTKNAPKNAPKNAKKVAGKKIQSPADKTITKPITPAIEKPENKPAHNHVEGNPYRPGSNYALIYDCLQKLGSQKPVSRKDLLKEVCKRSGKDEKHGNYDLSVVLSPHITGESHKSAAKPSLKYYVDKKENGMVQLHVR